MSPLRHLSRLTIGALLLALLPSLALEGHGPGRHVGAGIDDESIYLAGHQRADPTLHIEPVLATGIVLCHGCLLPDKHAGALGPGVAGKPLARPSSRLQPPPDHGAVFSPRSSRVPRAPPAL